MKKLLNLLAIATLASTSVSNVTTIINNNLNQQSISKINDVLLPNSSEVTGYNGDIKNYKIDLFGNVFFTTDNAIYKVNVGTTNAIEIFKFNIGEVDNLSFDSKDNLYFTIKTSDEENKFYKVSVGITTAVEITGYTGAAYSFFFDSKNNLYFYIHYKNGSSLNNKFYKVSVGITTAVEITGYTGAAYSFFFDSKNNLYFYIHYKNGSSLNNKFYKVNAGTTNAIEITGFNNNFNPQKFIKDSKDNLYFIDNISQNLGILESDKTEIENLNVTGIDIKDYYNIQSLNIDSTDNIWFNVWTNKDNKIYKINSSTNNAIEITDIGNGKFNNFKFDNKDNLYFTNESNLFIFDSEKHHYQLTDFKENTEYVFFTFDSKNNLYFTNESNLFIFDSEKHHYQLTDFKENTEYVFFTFDSKNNLYFTNESNLFIFDSEKHHYQLTDFKENTEYVFFTFDSKNNLYFGIKNSDETIDLYKQLYDEQKLIKIDDYVQNYEFTWKEQDNINFDNENNLYYVKKNNNEQLSIFYLKNNEWKSQLIFTFNKAITKFNFKIKNNIIFVIIDNKIYKVDKFNLPVAPEQPNGAILILITSSIGCLIIGGGLLGYFIYYDRKHHVIKKWWLKN